MKRVSMIVAVGLVAVLGFTAAPVVTAMTMDVTKVTLTRVAGDNDQVCPPGDSGKIDVSGNQHSVTVTAPAGMLISGYCVKAGSANQGLGPEFVTISPPQKTVTITHSSGKGISHYSLTFVHDTTTTGTHTTGTHTTGTHPTHPDTTGTHPDTTGTHPDTTGTHPDTTGTHPDTTGTHPDTTGTHPDTTGTHPDTTGTHPDTTGTHPDTTGTHPGTTTGTQTTTETGNTATPETGSTTQTVTTSTGAGETTGEETVEDVFTPPTSTKPGKGKDKGEGGTAVRGAAQQPTTAPQAAPLTP